ncbi:MAG: UDP-N-acetylmuramoyl-tripeptide--D-alanyl-D-alanine ligase [Patescibacteria group bacterium]
MQAVFKKIVRDLLRFLAKKRLEKIRPKIVGITGSVGKTSAKDAIAAVLERKFIIHKSPGGYNSDLGTLLTILEKPSGYSSIEKWIVIIFQCIVENFQKISPYDMLVMEMGIDYPGGMDEILEVVHPDLMVFLNVKDVHRGEGQFKNREQILEEKSKACYKVPNDGWVILNHDDMFTKQLENKLPAQVIKIGTEEGADLRAININADSEGLHFTLAYEGKEIPVFLKNILGDCHVYIVLAAIAVGFVSGLPWKTIEAGLADFKMPNGRMVKIEGKNQSTIIDSTYNASPDAMEEALKVLSLFRGRKIAALGSMNELGELAESAHIKIGKIAAEHADLLILVGKYAADMAEGASRGGMPKSMIHTFRTSTEAGKFLSGMLEKYDVVLAKGSQNEVRMEHLVKLCMRDPSQARAQLVRQEPYWLKNI